jgi:hypothetical protein
VFVCSVVEARGILIVNLKAECKTETKCSALAKPEAHPYFLCNYDSTSVPRHAKDFGERRVLT